MRMRNNFYFYVNIIFLFFYMRKDIDAANKLYPGIFFLYNLYQIM